MGDYGRSVAEYYASLSTDELLFILSTRELTAEAKESLERELKRRDISQPDDQVREIRDEEKQWRRPKTTAAYLFSSMVTWLGIGLCLMGITELIYGQSLPYRLLLIGLTAFATGLWMSKRSLKRVRVPEAADS